MFISNQPINQQSVGGQFCPTFKGLFYDTKKCLSWQNGVEKTHCVHQGLRQSGSFSWCQSISITGCKKASVCGGGGGYVPLFDHRSMAPLWGRRWYYTSYGVERKKERRGEWWNPGCFSATNCTVRSSLFSIHPASHTRSLARSCHYASEKQTEREARGRGWEDRVDGVLQGFTRAHETRRLLSGMLRMLSHLYMHIQLMLYK